MSTFALCRYAPGDEVFLTYGALCNLDLLGALCAHSAQPSVCVEPALKLVLRFRAAYPTCHIHVLQISPHLHHLVNMQKGDIP